MKNLEWQVSNSKLSKRLKKLNCKQESLFYWVALRFRKAGEGVTEGYSLFSQKELDKFIKELGTKIEEAIISAFTVSEIFPLLEKDITIPSGTKNIADYMAQLLVDKLSA